MSEDNVQQLEISDEFLMSSAEKRFETGNYLGALTMLNKRARLFPPSADSSALYGDIYEALGLYPLCADAWFRFLDTCNEADFAEGFEGLALAFMNMGDEAQSEIFYRRIFDSEEYRGEVSQIFEKKRPKLRLIHSADGSIGDPELLQKGLGFIRAGNLEEAKKSLSEIPEDSLDFPSASGLTALCLLLEGNTEEAGFACKRLLNARPDDVSALTTYCAVLGAQGDKEGAKEIGRRLAAVPTKSVEELFRISTALCETGLDEEAYEKLSQLKEKVPNSDDILWFHAIAAYKTKRVDEAISSLERLTTVYPRKAVAEYYLVRMREEGYSESLQPNYFYRLPDDEYKNIIAFLLSVNDLSDEEAQQFAELKEIEDYFRLSFDNLDGRDEKLQLLASKVAVKCRVDNVIREILLDYNADEFIKLSILRDLTIRNEENSFGTILCNFYREFFTHKIKIGKRKRAQFMNAFADVYSRYAIIAEDNENKIIDSAKSIYEILDRADATNYFDEQAEMAAVIYREARLKQSERSIEKIAEAFGANVKTVKEILNYLI